MTLNQQQIWNTDIVMKLIQPMKLVEITNEFFGVYFNIIILYDILIIYLHGTNGPADYIANYNCIV